MKNPTISVLLCTYNDALYIREAIESILSQSFADFEFLIIDDGSTDETATIIKSFSDKRIIYLKNPENKGLEFSKNRGIEVAKGKYIAYLDGDDKCHPNRLQAQFEFMEANPTIGFCTTDVKMFGTETGFYLSPQTDSEIRLKALFNTPLPHPACMIRKRVLLENNIRYRTDFPAAEDYPFMVDLLTKSKAGNVPKILFFYRMRANSISVKKAKTQEESTDQGGFYAFKKLLNIEVTAAEKAALKKLLFPPVLSLKTLFVHQQKSKISVPLQPIFENIKVDENDNLIRAEFKRFFIEKGRVAFMRYEKQQNLGTLGLLKEILIVRWRAVLSFLKNRKTI